MGIFPSASVHLSGWALSSPGVGRPLRCSWLWLVWGSGPQPQCPVLCALLEPQAALPMRRYPGRWLALSLGVISLPDWVPTSNGHRCRPQTKPAAAQASPWQEQLQPGLGNGGESPGLWLKSAVLGSDWGDVAPRGHRQCLRGFGCLEEKVLVHPAAGPRPGLPFSTHDRGRPGSTCQRHQGMR